MDGVKKIKVGIVCICLNQNYWEYAKEMLDGLNRYFLKKHDIRDKYEVKMMIWSDMPEGTFNADLIKVFQTEPIEWPLPTLMRYHLILQQEEHIKDFDYLYYIDIDMRITDWIGEEIINDKGLTLSLHPMYALRENLFFPYDPNPVSEAYVRIPGRHIDNGKGGKKFRPEYYAGGFQGGKTDIWISAMKEMRKMVDKDFNNNYLPRWNDESILNSFIFKHPEIDLNVLSPSFIYPDSLIADYYLKIWGRNYSPKIMTLTKKFSTNKEAGAEVAQQLATM